MQNSADGVSQKHPPGGGHGAVRSIVAVGATPISKAHGVIGTMKVIEQGVERYADYVALGHDMSDSAAVVKLHEHKAKARSSHSP